MVEIVDIYQLQSYKDLISIGAKVLAGKLLEPTQIIVNINHERFKHIDSPTNHLLDNLILYQNGKIDYKLGKEIIKYSTPIRGENFHRMTIEEWDARLSKIFTEIFDYIIIENMKLEGSIRNHIFRNMLTLNSKLNYLARNYISNLFLWIDALDSKTAEIVINTIKDEIIIFINQNPNKGAILFKNVYKNPALIKLFPLLDKNIVDILKKDLSLLGDLDVLGFDI